MVNDENKSVYRMYGFKNRQEYLQTMAIEYGVDVETAFALADVLGENEDFDGFVLALEDAAGSSVCKSDYSEMEDLI